MKLQGTTIQLLCFLTAEFPVQLLTKRYGFKRVLPILMMLWGLVCSSKQSFAAETTDRFRSYLSSMDD